ncbi:outer membrane beta-barrel protein [Pedobacter foliorum]|uniref:outer membrane beta-barrel protein n=1 Tax=Pedobacter foliorum TaxID=2739058 RepID=UPI0015649547|nr:outer membrane beta-barrel protein [Pedobacter foliorum]NRF39895.1 hypothetical protein [Pedobacter foliorum]
MKRSLLALFWVLPFLSVAQSNFQKGYVVTNSKDTLRGYIDYKESALNPSSIKFKDNPESKPRTLTIDECTAYSIDSLEKYERYIVSVSTSREELSNILVGRDSSFRIDTVLLKVLNRGKNVTLFSYKDDIKKRYYIMDKNEVKPVELVRNFYFKPDQPGRMLTENVYVRQLRSKMRLFIVPDLLDERILLRVNYGDKDLLKVIYKINDEQPVKSKFPASRFFAGTGLNISQARYNGGHLLAGSDAKSKTSYMPLITTGIDFFSNPSIGKLIYRVELSLLMSKNEISSSVQRHSFDQLSVAATPQVIYNFYNSNRIKVFGGIGFSLNLSSYSNNETAVYNPFKMRMDVTKDFVDMQNFNFSYQGTAGVVLNKKIEISLGYIGSAAITNYTFYSVTMQRYKVGVNYLFGKH